MKIYKSFCSYLKDDETRKKLKKWNTNVTGYIFFLLILLDFKGGLDHSKINLKSGKVGECCSEFKFFKGMLVQPWICNLYV